MRAAVDAGDYASTGEVIRDAMRDWTLKQQAKAADIERLRKAWQEGIESGSAGAFDIKEFKFRAREELARRQKRAGNDR
ncbi:type II toxin-antitoxin system ParD family antitoxin [Breoghania sp. L-A4]|uniref:ribbon-helix-helix domain-containing protein n=1 Tax=Breoghania sp. L-A4 TaxID=2304600 RepID=UPI0020BEE265|nr:type II toxin-antitoxin system ParD family antitoxin [Breoghania sp. L-A4]